MTDRVACNLAITLGVSVLIMLANCKSGHVKRELSDDSLRTGIKSPTDPNLVTEYNNSRRYALIWRRLDPKEIGIKSIHFRIIRLHDNVVVYEGSYMRGYVKWIDDVSLEKLSIPGKVKEDRDMSDFKEIIRIEEGKPKLK